MNSRVPASTQCKDLIHDLTVPEGKKTESSLRKCKNRVLLCSRYSPNWLIYGIAGDWFSDPGRFFPKMHRFFNGAEIGDPPKNDNSYVDPLTKKHIFTNVMSQKNLKIKPKQPGWFLSLILSKLFKQKIHLPVLALQTSIWGLSLCQPSLFDHKVFPYPKNVSSQEHLEAKSKNLQWPRRFPHIESGWPGPWGREWGEISIWSTLLGVEVLRFFLIFLIIIEL